MRLDQRLGHRRHPADQAIERIDFVDANNAHLSLDAVRLPIGHCRAEEDLVVAALTRGVDHLCPVESSGQEADAPVDLAKPLLAVKIVAIFGPVTVGGRP